MTETRLRAIVDTAVDGIILMNADGTITMFNPACERMFGYPSAEIVGGDVKRLMPSPYRDEHDQYLENHRRTGQRKIIGIGREVLGRRSNGETFPMDLSIGEAGEGGDICFVGIVRDVTERKRTEALREQLITHLTASNVERSHFAHVASHDLREPLRMVTAYCGLLARDYSDRLDDRGREFLTLMLSGTAQMTGLLDDLVDYGRLGQEAGQASWFQTEDSLDQAMLILADPVRESGAEITHGPLPTIHGNPLRFMRLLQNLIGNALKYVENGTAPRIYVSAVITDGLWRFSVADNGIGIAPRHHDQIFEPFKRLHARSTYQGTGLGLAICRRIVADFGGDLSVTSAEGEGSTFSFTVKLHDAEPGE